MDNTKIISILPLESKKEKTIKTTKQKQKRQITTTKKWTFTETDFFFENQWKLLNEIYKNEIVNGEHCQFIIRQINNKIYGYHAQDIDKHLLCAEKFIKFSEVLDLLLKCENNCFYCKEKVQVLYEYVREPKQWTLDRLDNKFGHNSDNVVIACLSCNLRRKTMHHDRYVFTKQLVITKI